MGTRPRDAEAWELLTRETAVILGLDDDEDATVIERENRRLISHVRKSMARGRDISNLPSNLLATMGEAAFKSAYANMGAGRI